MDRTFRMKSYTADIHDKIARVYYSHGLFCSSHPYFVIFVTVTVFVLCCYPLIYLPLLGSTSQHYTTPVHDFIPPDIVLGNSDSYKFNGPRWFQGPPISYVQQIVVKSALSPWKPDLIITDAFRAPLSTSFQITELLRNHQFDPSGKNQTSLGDLCLQLSEPIDHLASKALPHYSCLIVSPSNIWSNDLDRFKDDSDFIKTIFKVKDSSVDPSSLREILFGVPFKETGIKKLYVCNRPRIITYAITIAFQTYNSKFISSLHNHVREKFPTSPYPENITFTPEEQSISHVHFQNLHTLLEFVPLVMAYVILFLYIYFSVCRFIKNTDIINVDNILKKIVYFIVGNPDPSAKFNKKNETFRLVKIAYHCMVVNPFFIL